MIKVNVFALVTFVIFCSDQSSAQTSRPATTKPTTPKTKPPTVTKPVSTTSAAGQELKFFIIKDSSYERWNVTGSQELYGNATMDSSGIIYALITDDAGSDHVGRLQGNEWTPCDSALEAPVEKLLNDGNGVVYAKTSKQLYRLDEPKWTKVYDTTKADGSVPWPALDGALYRRIPIYNASYDVISNEIVKVENGKDIPIGLNGQPFRVGRGTEYYIDRRGNIYTIVEHAENKYYDPPKKDVLISMSNGKTDPIIGRLPYPIINSGFDADNNWYVSGYDGKNGATAYFKKWDGKEWTDIPMPPGIRTDNVFSVAKFFFDTKGNMYLLGKGADHNDKLIAWKDGKWKEVCSADSEPPYLYLFIDEFMVGGNNIYGVHYGWNIAKKKSYIEVFKRTGVWKVNKMEVADIPHTFDYKAADLYIGYTNFYNFYLFKENDKYGIQDRKGHVVAEAVFDKITCIKTPAHVRDVHGDESMLPFTDYCYELISGKDTIRASIGSSALLPGTLEGLKKTVSSVCRRCNGTGKVAERREQVYVRGDWVKERSTTGSNIAYDYVWDAANRRYVTVKTTTTTTNTSGGYYKSGGYKTEVIPGGVCTACYGKASVWNFEIYMFDQEKRQYVKSWK